MKKKIFAIAFIGLAFIIGCNSVKNQNDESTVVSFKNMAIADLVSYNETLFPSYNANYPPPAGAKEVFQLSQNYPKKITPEEYPWLKIEFVNEPEKYMAAVLKYCLEGNIEVDFKGQLNKIRKWYHAPWLHDDGKYTDSADTLYIGNGREYIHGLTRERATPKDEMHPQQNTTLENWAVGMYNEPGGYTIGQVWSSPNSKPDPTKANFPEGTVSFKLLFSDGTIDKVPFLKNSLEWEADIYPCDPTTTACPNKKREIRKVHLLQIDIGVKDKRAPMGWVFGTFIYDASSTGKTVWERMVPVGLNWGSDSGDSTDLHKDGAFINKHLKESYLNKNLIPIKDEAWGDKAFMKHHGLGGRLNGPVDNPISSCMSCHGQAGVNAQGRPLPMGNFSATRLNYPLSSFDQYFANVSPGSYKRSYKGSTYVNLDYSLQLSAGIRNYYNNENIKIMLLENAKANNISTDSLKAKDVRNASQKVEPLPEVTRGE